MFSYQFSSAVFLTAQSLLHGLLSSLGSSFSVSLWSHVPVHEEGADLPGEVLSLVMSSSSCQYFLCLSISFWLLQISLMVQLMKVLSALS